MNKLIGELQRLYFLRDQAWLSQKFDAGGNPVYDAEGTLTSAVIAGCLAGEKAVWLALVGADARARAMVVEFARASDWEQAAMLHHVVQNELDLPAPAVSVSGRNGFRIWFSLAEPLPAEEVRHFLEALRDKYLPDMPPSHLRLCPGLSETAATGTSPVCLVPALHTTTGKWSAFIDPSMGSMFVDEPGLEMAPTMDRQADLLSRLESIKVADFQRALGILQAPPDAEATLAECAASGTGASAGQGAPIVGRARERLNVGNHFTDPQSFLLAVMNDPVVSAGQRIKAAKALLPYFASRTARGNQ